GDVVRRLDFCLEQLRDAELLGRLRNSRVHTAGVVPHAIDLGWVGAELRAPLHPRDVSHHEPTLVVLEPQSAAVVVLPGFTAKEVLDGAGQFVHDQPRLDVGFRIGSSRVIGNGDRTRMVFRFGIQTGTNGKGRTSAPAGPVPGCWLRSSLFRTSYGFRPHWTW